jgi:trigger factor
MVIPFYTANYKNIWYNTDERRVIRMDNNRPPIPEPLKRDLRQEAFFGCVICGSPIIEFHHIEPYSIVKCHVRSNLVVLCPEHHHRANCGEISKEKIIKSKYNPFNKKNLSVGKDISLNLYDQLIGIKIGNIIFRNTPIILEIDKKPIISITKDIEGYSLFNAFIYDENNNLLACIINNEWNVSLEKPLWDIKYSPGHLIINNVKNKIFLELETLNNCIELRCNLFYNGYNYIGAPTKSIIDNGITVSGTGLISGSLIGVLVDTKSGSTRIGVNKI